MVSEASCVGLVTVENSTSNKGFFFTFGLKRVSRLVPDEKNRMKERVMIYLDPLIPFLRLQMHTLDPLIMPKLTPTYTTKR